MNPQRPRFLYKYLPGRLDRIAALVADRKARFTCPTSFDDPFDCSLGIRFPDPASLTAEDEQLLQAYMCHLEKETGVLTTVDGHTLTAKEAIASGQHRRKSFLGAAARDIEVHIRDVASKMGVFCLSETAASVSMWAIYASNHRGAVIELDHHALGVDDNDIRSFPVDYANTLPNLADYMAAVNSSEPTSFPRLFFCRKSSDWSYQAEWRFLTNAPDKDLLLPSNAITRVIFGHRMSREQKNRIGKLIPINSGIKAADAVPSRCSFSMDIIDGVLS